VKKGYLADNRIAVLGNDNHCYVKEGDLNAGWDDEFADVSDCVVPNGD
jgi:hypothetical protein